MQVHVEEHKDNSIRF